ncbi:MAG: hypothetical protein R3D29_15830 [Nitratireductor sp.]
MEHGVRYGAPLADTDAYGSQPEGAWLNRIHTYEVSPANAPAQIVHFPKSCLHCDDAPQRSARPVPATSVRKMASSWSRKTSASPGLCAWACPYGAREMDPVANVMKKCTLC